jgi:hypothetical protein
VADVLIRIRDKELSGDAEVDAQNTKRGDVIAICETPWPWGFADLANPDWRILRLVLIPSFQLLELLTPELGIPDAKGNTALRRTRSKRLNVDSVNWPANVRTWLADDTRATPIFSSSLTLENIQNFYETKVPR